MAKSFMQAFEEWKKESYKIGEDIGWEYADSKETGGPTPPACSSTTPDNGPTHPAKEVLDPRQEA